MLYLLSNLEKRYRNRKALDIERLEIPEDSVCALLGPNGSGKTTLLHVLAFLSSPSRGTLHFMGEPVDWHENRLHRLRRKVVLVEQHPIMFTTSVMENVAYGLRVRGVPASGRFKVAAECLERVGMAEYADRPAHRLSGGETRRAAIARALACRPDVMLLDEPTAGIDTENQVLVESILRDIRPKTRNQQGMSIVFSTHDRIQAERLAGMRVYLRSGRPAQATSENRFPIEMVRKSGFLARVAERASRRGMPPEKADDGICLSIDPQKIRIAVDWQSPSVISEAFSSFSSGRILTMSMEAGRVRMLLDVGSRDDAGADARILLCALLPPDFVRGAGMVAGDSVQVALDDGAAVLASDNET